MKDDNENDSGWIENVYTLDNEDLLNANELDAESLRDYDHIEDIFIKRYEEDWTNKTPKTDYMPPILFEIIRGKNSLEKFNELNRFLRFLSDKKAIFLEAVLHIFSEYLDDDYNKLECVLNVVNKRQLDVMLSIKYGIPLKQKNLFGK